MAEWSLTLNSRTKMPAFGLGTYIPNKKGEIGDAIELALKEGYRHIDCAHIYRNEVEIGEALQKCFKEGVIKREDIFVTSKLWCTEHEYNDVLPACNLTLKNLQLDYLDLYLVHWPLALEKGADGDLSSLKDEQRLGYDPEREAKCWEAMEELVSKGLVKAIGISNFTITKTERLLQTAKIVPAVNQVECHPYLQQQNLKEYCDSKGIVLEAYSPLGNPGSPYRKEEDPNMLEDPIIKDIAEKHKVTIAQVCIAFALHRGMAVISKTVTPSRIVENIKATEVKLDAEDRKSLRELENKNFRLITGAVLVAKGVDIDEYIWDKTEDAKFDVKESDSKKQKT